MSIVVKEESKDDTYVLTLSGLLVGDGPRHLKAKFDELYERGAKNILLDVTRVSYPDGENVYPESMVVLTEAYINATSRGGIFRLLNPSASFLHQIRAFQLQRIFTILQGRETAVILGRNGNGAKF